VDGPRAAGLPVCMPYNAPSLAHALANANNFHWITGNLAAPFPPASAGPGSPQPDPWRCLQVAWDKYAPRGWPARVSPWEVRSPEAPAGFPGRLSGLELASG